MNSLVNESCDLYWLDVLCVSEIISNLILSKNYTYWFISFDFHIIWKSKKWGLSTYISLILEVSNIGKIVGFRFFFFFCRNSFTFQKYTRDHILTYYLSYDCKFVSGNVHITWQIISLYYFFYCFTDHFQSIILIQSASKADTIFS